MRPAVIKRRRGQKLPEGAVYIGRPSRWGNPFKISKDVSREQTIELYREHLAQHPELVDDLARRKPTGLACWCAPLPCHGDLLADALERRSRDA